MSATIFLISCVSSSTEAEIGMGRAAQDIGEAGQQLASFGLDLSELANDAAHGLGRGSSRSPAPAVAGTSFVLRLFRRSHAQQSADRHQRELPAEGSREPWCVGVRRQGHETDHRACWQRLHWCWASLLAACSAPAGLPEPYRPLHRQPHEPCPDPFPGSFGLAGAGRRGCVARAGGGARLRLDDVRRMVRFAAI